MLHDLHAWHDIGHDSRCNFTQVCWRFITWIDFNNLRALLTGIVQITLQTVVLLVIDNRGVILIMADVRIHAFDTGFKMIDKLGSFATWQEHIIRRYAGLSGIPELAHGNTLSHITQVNRWMHQYRGLATQFQDYWYQIFSSRCHHGFTDSC